MADFYEKLPENPTTPSGPRSWFEFSRWLSIVQRLLRSITAIHWDDIHFPMSPPKTTGAGNPSLVTWNGNLRGFAFAIGDAHDFDPQEFKHNGKQNSTAYLHIHFINRSNDGTNRAVKWRIEFAQANRSESYAAPTVVETEIAIPAGGSVNTMHAVDLTSFTTQRIVSIMYVRLTRIAASIAGPTLDPVVCGVHYHYQLDSNGSREVFTK